MSAHLVSPFSSRSRLASGARTESEPAGAGPPVGWPRFGIIGAGPMGLSLAAVLGGPFPVALVVRDPQPAAAIRAHGAVACGLLEGRAVPAVVDRIGGLVEHAPFDVVFVATKTTAIEAVSAELGPILPALSGLAGPPYVVSFQNGIDPGRALMERLRYPRVLRMVLNFGAAQRDARTAEVMLDNPPHFIGAPGAEHLRAARRIASTLTACGLPTQATENIESRVWEKGVLNAAMNPVAALTDSSVGGVLDSPARRIVAGLLEEGLAVAEAEGVGLGPEAADRMWRTLEAARAHTPSMVSDVRSGRPSEVGQLNRQIIAHGARVGIATPTHELIASLIDAFDWRVFQRRSRDHDRPPTLAGALR